MGQYASQDDDYINSASTACVGFQHGQSSARGKPAMTREQAITALENHGYSYNFACGILNFIIPQGTWTNSRGNLTITHDEMTGEYLVTENVPTA
jgi:hypothetical protein